MASTMPMSALLSALRGAGRQHLTASTVGARQAITGSHVLRLHRYTQVIQKELPTGESLGSATFSLGGYEWRIICYPNGFDTTYSGCTSLFIRSLTPSDPVYSPTAQIRASVLDGAGKPCHTQATEPWTFARSKSWGWKDFVKNDDLNLADDCLTVLCDVTVQIPPLRVEVATDAADPPPEPTAAAAPPPFDVRGLLAEAIWSKPTDVTVHAGGEAFAAHRWVLEARSPVFKAELQKSTTYAVDGMEPDVLKALLQFMYTDTLPTGCLVADATMAERLLVSADRYGLDKLKLACGEALCTHVDMGSIDNAIAMLALADRYGPEKLRLACEDALCARVDMGSGDAMLALADRYGLEKLKLASGEALCTSVDMCSVGPMLALAERHRCGVLKEACMKFLSRDGNLTSFMATDGYEQLKKDCPYAAVDIVAEQLPS
ncbi:unnamed protein product [Alopecurus aequalis]